MSADVLHRSMVMLASCSALVAVSHGKLSKVTSGSGARERERERGRETRSHFCSSQPAAFWGHSKTPPRVGREWRVPSRRVNVLLNGGRLEPYAAAFPSNGPEVHH